MNRDSSDNTETRIADDAWKKARRLWSFMFAAPAVCVILAAVLAIRNSHTRLVDMSPEAEDVLFFVCIGVGVLSGIIAFSVNKGALAQEYILRHFRSMGQVAQHLGHATVLTSTLSQVSVIMGVACLALAEEPLRTVIFPVMSVLFLRMVRPDRTRFMELVGLFACSGDSEDW